MTNQRIILYISSALSFVVYSDIFIISNFTVLFPKVISTTSPTETSFEGFAGLPFTETWEEAHASFATVRRFISRETLRNLSNLINAVNISGCPEKIKTACNFSKIII